MTTMRSRISAVLEPDPQRAFTMPVLASLLNLQTPRERTLLSVTLREMSLRGEICAWFPDLVDGRRGLKLFAIEAPPGKATTPVRTVKKPVEHPAPPPQSVWPFQVHRREMRNAPGIWISNPRRSYVPVGPSNRGNDD